MGRKSLAIERRRQILRGAAALFIRKGYLNTSVRDIAGELGMNVATLYHYVGSKNGILGLFHEYTMNAIDFFSKKYQTVLERMEPQRALKYAVREYLKWVEEYQDLTVFWYQEAKNLTPAQFGALKMQEECTIRIFQKILERGVRSGKFKVKNPALAANNIVVLCDMWAFRRWLLKEHYTLEQYIAEQMDLIMAQVSRSGRDR
ncbi:MAG: TetR/AcrR family transcriptional regulator [Dehalococcoidia bacterium]|nr:TetR/AcrR family transcriptional regulator [Dehalococcoidia bacterium]MDD5648607.1 TetR/AcrR family transcriptional regulator [Dehalococcoidia bacterium]